MCKLGTARMRRAAFEASAGLMCACSVQARIGASRAEGASGESSLAEPHDGVMGVRCRCRGSVVELNVGASKFSPGGFPVYGGGMVTYHAVITRDFPHWTAIITGPHLPESGHVITSLSYARLTGEVHDWCHWHRFGTPSSTYGWPDPAGQVLDDDEAGVGTAGQGYGVSVNYDCRLPKAAKDAQERFWAARKATQNAERALNEPVCTLARELKAEPADVAKMLLMSVDEVHQIIIRDNRARRHGMRAQRDGESSSA